MGLNRSRPAQGRRSAVAVANEQVSILYVCGLLSVSVPDEVPYGRSVKVHCPFGAVYHPDGGHESALRLYVDTNSAYCFSEKQYYTPVSLYAAAYDVDFPEAAQQLLDLVGYAKLDVQQEWQRVVEHKEPVSRDSLSEALKVYCSRIDPLWEEKQFDAAVAEVLSRCLGLLPRVGTEDDAVRWLGVSKQVMARTLRGEQQ